MPACRFDRARDSRLYSAHVGHPHHSFHALLASSCVLGAAALVQRAHRSDCYVNYQAVGASAHGFFRCSGAITSYATRGSSHGNCAHQSDRRQLHLLRQTHPGRAELGDPGRPEDRPGRRQRGRQIHPAQLILGQLAPETGSIFRVKDLTIGYLPQDAAALLPLPRRSGGEGSVRLAGEGLGERSPPFSTQPSPAHPKSPACGRRWPRPKHAWAIRRSTAIPPGWRG